MGTHITESIDNRICGIQRYVGDVLGYRNMYIPGHVELPVYIFEHIFREYQDDIWFKLGQLHGSKHRSKSESPHYITLIIENNVYSLHYVMGVTYLATDFDDETNNLLYSYFTSIKRKENLKKLLNDE